MQTGNGPREAVVRSRRGLGWALLSLCLIAEARAAGWGGMLGVATDSVFRGVSRNDGRWSPLGDLHYAAEGAYVGLLADEVRRGEQQRTAAELVAYAAYQRSVSSDWSATAEVRRYQYPTAQRYEQFNYDELSVSLGWRSELTATVVASPDTYAVGRVVGGRVRSGNGAAYDCAAVWRQPLPQGLSLDAGLGYYDLRRQLGAGYTYWNVDLGYQRRSWQIDLSYIGTDSRARRLFEYEAGDRLVASAFWTF